MIPLNRSQRRKANKSELQDKFNILARDYNGLVKYADTLETALHDFTANVSEVSASVLKEQFNFTEEQITSFNQAVGEKLKERRELNTDNKEPAK